MIDRYRRRVAIGTGPSQPFDGVYCATASEKTKLAGCDRLDLRYPLIVACAIVKATMYFELYTVVASATLGIGGRMAPAIGAYGRKNMVLFKYPHVTNWYGW
jgi:hypothetical protein